MFGVKKHSCGDSRLACVYCNQLVCPTCMIACPVGNRCAACAVESTNHIYKVSAAILAKTMIAAFAAGYLTGLFASLIEETSMFGGVYGWVLLFGGGTVVGDLLHRVAGYKRGPRVILSVAGGTLAGFLSVLLPPGYVGAEELLRLTIFLTGVLSPLTGAGFPIGAWRNK